MSSRRDFLAIAGMTAAGLAGCLGDTPGVQTDTTAGTTTTDRPTTSRTTTVTRTNTTPHAPVEMVAVRRSIRTMGVAHLVVRGGLYVVAIFSGVEAADRARSSATLVLDGERRDPIDRLVRPLDGGAGLAFELPPEGLDVDDGRLTVGERERVLEAATLERLADPPVFEVQTFEVPRQASAPDTVNVRLTVANTGGSDGRFLAELGTTRLSDRSEIAVSVPAGSHVTRVVSVDLYGRAESRSESIVLEFPDGTEERTVTYPGDG